MKRSELVIIEHHLEHQRIIGAVLEGTEHTVKDSVISMTSAEQWLNRLMIAPEEANTILIGDMSVMYKPENPGLKIVHAIQALDLMVHILDYSTEGLALPPINGVDVSRLRTRQYDLPAVLDSLPEVGALSVA